MGLYYSKAAMASLAATDISTRYGYHTPDLLTRALNEAVASKIPSATVAFDIFLSYRWEDRDVVYGVYKDLIRRGYTVYLDKVMDPHLSRDIVTIQTVEVLRQRLMQSKSLFYAATDNSSDSRWMPWELGFEDGYRGKSAVLPITDSNTFTGVEFLQVYPRVFPTDSALGMAKPDGSFLSLYDTWRDSVPARKCGMPVCPLPR